MFKSTKTQPRSLATRDTILSIALALFRRDGLDNTTVRGIAKQADVALGAAYYYYASKEAILQAYYDQVQEKHHARVLEALVGKKLSLEDRLRTVCHAKLDILRDDRRILGALYRYAGEPSHPLSALGPATRKNREQAIRTFDLALEGEKLPEDIRSVLPALLWAAHMGILLFYIYDDSPEQQRTRRLVDGAMSLVCLLLSLVRMPVFRPFRGRLSSLLTDAGLTPAPSAAVTHGELL